MSVDTREDRLPQWAQREIQRLRQNLEAERLRLAELTSVADGAIVRDPYENPVAVATARETLRINLPNREHLDMRWTGGWLEIRSNSALEIQGQASNVIRVRSAEYWRSA